MSKLARLLVAMTGRAAARRFDRAARDPEEAQRRTLLDIVRRNRDTEYGRAHGFSAIHTLEEYRHAVPVITYEDIREPIERMTRGERNVLTAEPPVMFARTSGTTGVPKYIPVTATCRGRCHRDQMRTWLYHALRDHPTIFDGKVMSLVSPAVEGHTPSGIPFGSTSGVMYRDMPSIVRGTYAIPYPLFEIEEYELRYYCLLRVALAHRVTLLATANPSSVLTLCEMAEEHADDLLRDIANGTVRGEEQLPTYIRDALHGCHEPMPERAHELERAMSKREGRLLPADYWQDLALIGCWKGGTVGHYLERFGEYFDPDSTRPVPVRDWGYLSSEARCSIPISDEGDGGALVVEGNVCEFVPVEQVDENPEEWSKWEMRGAHELEEGESYAVILTTTGGLYRYDINDIVRVVGFHHRAPIISFVRKGRGVTSITGEKVTVDQVIEAVERSGQSVSVEIPHFKVEASIDESCYVFKVELDSAPSPEILRRLLTSLEENLSRLNIEYAGKRQSLRLEPPVLQVMKSGWYDQARSQRQRDNQAKTILLTDEHDDADEPFVSRTVTLGAERKGGARAKRAAAQR